MTAHAGAAANVVERCAFACASGIQPLVHDANSLVAAAVPRTATAAGLAAETSRIQGAVRISLVEGEPVPA
jgi:hypothetical protein